MKTIKICLLIVIITSIIGKFSVQAQKYQPDFESLEKSDPVPEWFKDAKFGIYYHWGVFSVPAFGNEWYPRSMYADRSPENIHHKEVFGDITEWPYDYFISGAKDRQGNFVQFAPRLKSAGGNFDPDEWAQLFADAGAKFAGPVAEHHDGFSMWASKVNPWNSKDMGPHLDLVGLITDAIRKQDMKLMLSMHHAYNITGYYSDVPPTNDPKLQILYGQQSKEENEKLWLNKHKEIIDFYKPDIIYQDFNLHIISQSVLLEFLAYYYNKASELNQEVVATFKDGLNKKCAVLDFERGGPPDITDYYWLTDDAISSSSWCYTEGIGYYSKTQILHSFIDRISKNGNMVLNISPKADGTIPQEQKDVLLAMGSWLKKYGEAIYSTRAWEQYGEGPTKMGAAHGIMMGPVAGTAQDIRYTRNKDNTILYAILLGWDKDQKQVNLSMLSSEKMNCSTLKSVELINNESGKYQLLASKQTSDGLTVILPEKSFEESAYVLKLSFDGKIPVLDNYVEVDCAPYYYLIPGEGPESLVLGSDLTLTGKRKDLANQWKLVSLGKGYYEIRNRENKGKVLECASSSDELIISDFSGKDGQLWKIENSFNGLLKISNKQFPLRILSINNGITEGNKVSFLNSGKISYFGWKLKEVCEMVQSAYKPIFIPGTIEAEDYDNGCPNDAYIDKDDINEGAKYRLNSGVDIENCTAGGFNVGWTRAGEWLAYTVTINKSANYQVSFYVASVLGSAKAHLACDGVNLTGTVAIPNTGAYQKWEIIQQTVRLEAGNHQIQFFIDSDGLNLDKIVLEEIK